MPLYRYEAIGEQSSCDYCRGGFDIVQKLADDKLAVCPRCGAAIRRVICAPALGHSQTDLHYRAKRAGFHTLKRTGKGEYEKLY